MFRAFAFTLVTAAAVMAGVKPFEPAPMPAAKAIKPAKAMAQPLDLFAPERAAQWTVENPPADATDLFAIAAHEGKPALRIAAGRLDPGRSTVRILLPGDGPANGDLWAKNKASFVTFLCKSEKPAQLTFHLLQRGKSAGTYQARFDVAPGDWQRVTLSIQQFGLKSFQKVAGVGFRRAQSDTNTVVHIADVSVGAAPFTDDLFKPRRLSVSLKGDWFFAADSAEQGMSGKWFDANFDDSGWRVLQSGKSWQEQGVTHHGWGWYRQKIRIPKEFAGFPLRVTLNNIASDDEAWFNGTRIGGISGEYKYQNHIQRSYVVPPSAIRFGELNTLAVRIWGGDLTFIGDKSGLISGPLTAEIDPYDVWLRDPGGPDIPAELYDLSAAQRGKPFEAVIRLPAELAQNGARLAYRVTDAVGSSILAGRLPLTAAADAAHAVIAFDSAAAQTVYLRGRLRIMLIIEDSGGQPLYLGQRDLDRLNFTARDNTPLPVSSAAVEKTPYGELRLVDEIDCATSISEEAHPYLQSGFDHAQAKMTPGSPVNVTVSEIMGRKARECDYGWFAYRVGRGKLKPHATYLLRIEYPEDQPRFCPVEIQTGQNYMDVGWKNGVGENDVYDNWPLSKTWQWYDVIVPLDDQTVGTGGTGSAPAENGFWVYFMNKRKPDAYYAMWSAGPAVGRIKLYEIDPDKHAPAITYPAGLPRRTLSFDWERQADHQPADLVRYARLMGYNAISPLIIKWAFMNYSPALSGYTTFSIDARDYWVRKLTPPLPSQHERYLEVTRNSGLAYIPRIEWGGSTDLPREAWATDEKGQPTKPNRFAPWCANLLHPATWDDLQRLVDHLVKPYAADNPQLAGLLWRIRSYRLPPSYAPADIQLFSKETNTPLPPGGESQWAAWAAGEMRGKFDQWWLGKRAAFHARLVKLLQSYRPDLALYYYNWDEDKFGLIEPDITAWAFVSEVVKPPPAGGRAAYEKERQRRRQFTAADYLETFRTGNFGKASKGLNRADLAIRPELYDKVPGFRPFAPANYLCYASLPEYLNYFRVADGVAVSNVVSYDEIAARSINPKYEGNMITPAGPNFSMALELLAWFHADARTLNYTVYTYGRGFADAHRRFAQAFLALPAIDGAVVDQNDPDLKVRTYAAPNGTYVGVAYKGHAAKSLRITLPVKAGAELRNLVTDQVVPSKRTGESVEFTLDSEAMTLHAFLLK